MFRNFDEFGRRNGRLAQTVDIPHRNGNVRQPRNLREAYWLLQQELQQVQSEKTAWQNEAGSWQNKAQKLEKELQRVKQQQAQTLAAANARLAEMEAESAISSADKTENDDWQEKYTRLYAEFENNKKRLEQRFANEAELEKENILRDMLPLADNLERALAHAKDSEDETGIALTLKAFITVLQQYGIQSIAEEGDPFNPEYHEAIGVVVNEAEPAGTIMAVEQKGYLLNEKLLRPARVLVVAE